MSEYHKIGDIITGDHPAVFQLDLYDLVGIIKASDYKVDAVDIDPRIYYVTSGDAISKTIYMQKMIRSIHLTYSNELCNKEQELTSEVQEVLMENGLKDYVSALNVMLSKIDQLLSHLYVARSDNCFLETEWENHTLLCIPKNPRKFQ